MTSFSYWNVFRLFVVVFGVVFFSFVFLNCPCGDDSDFDVFEFFTTRKFYRSQKWFPSFIWGELSQEDFTLYIPWFPYQNMLAFLIILLSILDLFKMRNSIYKMLQVSKNLLSWKTKWPFLCIKRTALCVWWIFQFSVTFTTINISSQKNINHLLNFI